jgi:ABC-type uncharacterized transport system involved in gliding motility auxiliary subunit
MSDKKNASFWKASGGLLGLLLLLIIIIAANVIIGNMRLRIDLTDEKLYTLSDGTKNVLAKLDQPVTLKLFFSKSYSGMPIQLKNYARQVEDLLREYEIASKGQVTIEHHDPKPDSDAEDIARRHGIAQQQVEMFGPPVYIGLAAVAGEYQAVIPALDPRTERLLEYNLTRLIYRVVHPQKPGVGVMSSMPVLGSQAPSFGFPQPGSQKPPWLAFREIEDDYDLRQIDVTADEIPSDLQTLVLVHAKDLSDATLYAIDQFVLRGGHLLAFIDPFSLADLEASTPQPYAPPSNASSLGRLFEAWGVGYDAGKMLADMKAVTPLRGQGNQPEESPVFLTLSAENISKEDTLTSQLGSLMFPFSGAFEDKTGAGLKFTSLVVSSDIAALVDVQMARFGAAAITRDFTPNATPLDLAIRLEGTFPTAFPDGKPLVDSEAREKELETPNEATSLQSGESAVVLVADSDLIYDRFCVQELNFFGTTAHQPLNDNVAFFANALEQMSGSSDMIGIRSRGEFSRPFDRVVTLEEEARRQWQEQERLLTEKLQETRRQLSQLQSEKNQEQRLFLSREQEQAVQRFKDEEIRVNAELKNVRKSLRKEIEQLEMKVKLANIVVMPALIALIGLGYGLRRRRRRS